MAFCPLPSWCIYRGLGIKRFYLQKVNNTGERFQCLHSVILESCNKNLMFLAVKCYHSGLPYLKNTELNIILMILKRK